MQEIKKVFARLVLPYFAWSVVYLYIDGTLSNVERWKAIFTLRGIAPLWFLAALALCYICFNYLHFAMEKYSESIQRISLFIIMILCFAVGYVMWKIKLYFNMSVEAIGTSGLYIFITVGRFFVTMSFFIVGYLVAKYNVIKVICKKRWNGLLVGIVLIVVMVSMVKIENLSVNLHLFNTNHYGVFLSTAFLGSIGIMLISYSLSEILSVFSYLGKESMGIMILHYVPFKMIYYSVKITTWVTDNVYMLSIISCVLALSACYYVVILIKKRTLYL